MLRRPRIGDRIAVNNWENLRVVVESVEPEYSTDRVKIMLDWGEHGKSRVWLHDYGKTWKFQDEVN